MLLTAIPADPYEDKFKAAEGLRSEHKHPYAFYTLTLVYETIDLWTNSPKVLRELKKYGGKGALINFDYLLTVINNHIIPNAIAEKMRIVVKKDNIDPVFLKKLCEKYDNIARQEKVLLLLGGEDK
jgi:hypothetical protein